MSFDPPSDFVDDDGAGSGSRKKTVLKVFGIGCAVVVLVLGLLGALGAFKAVSCCNDITNVGIHTGTAQKQALAFGDAVSSSNFEAMHQLLAPEYKAQLSPEKLKELYAPHQAILASCVNLTGKLEMGDNVENLEDVQRIKSWKISMRCFPREANQVLNSHLTLKLMEQEQPEEGGNIKVTHLNVLAQPLDIASEAPVQSVKEMHGLLQAENLDQAWMKMSPEHQKSQGKPQFVAFIKDQGDLFTKSTMDVRELHYVNTKKAQVVALLTAASGKKAIVTYELQHEMGFWRVASFTPLIETVDKPAAQLPQDEGDMGQLPDQSEESQVPAAP